ncbi:MFS transporter [Spirillospora sp. NPDC046719]
MTEQGIQRVRDRERFGPRLAGALIVLACAVGLDVSSVAVVNAALPAIGRGLSMNEATLQWLMTGYAVTFAGFLLFSGRLADIFSRRAVFALGVGVFTVAAFAAAMAPTQGVLIMARSLQGVGAAVSGPAAMALLFQLFPEGPLRNRALGVYTAVGASSFSAGLVFGGLLTDAFGWRSVFVFNAIAGTAVLAGIEPLLPPGTSNRRPLDIPGAAMVTAGLLMAVFGISRGGERGWGDPYAIGALAVAMCALVAFTVWEARTAEPLLPFSIFRSAPVRAATLAAVVFYAVVISVLFFAPLYMQGMLGYSPLESGLAMVPMGALVALFANVATRLMTRGVGQRALMVLGLLLIAGGVAYFTRTPLGGGYLPDILPGVALMGIGQGLAYAGLTAATVTGVPQHQHGVAGAFNITAQQVGGSVGTAVLVVIAAGAAAGPGQQQQLHGYHTAYLLSSIVAVIGAAVIAVMPGLRLAASDPRRRPA